MAEFVVYFISTLISTTGLCVLISRREQLWDLYALLGMVLAMAIPYALYPCLFVMQTSFMSQLVTLQFGVFESFLKTYVTGL